MGKKKKRGSVSDVESAALIKVMCPIRDRDGLNRFLRDPSLMICTLNTKMLDHEVGLKAFFFHNIQPAFC